MESHIKLICLEIVCIGKKNLVLKRDVYNYVNFVVNVLVLGAKNIISLFLIIFLCQSYDIMKSEKLPLMKYNCSFSGIFQNVTPDPYSQVCFNEGHSDLYCTNLFFIWMN